MATRRFRDEARRSTIPGLLPPGSQSPGVAMIATRDLTFVDAMGKVIGSIPIYDVTVNEAGQDVELPRGELTTLLYRLTRESAVRYRFKASIEAFEDDGAGVDVRFTSGEGQRYDVVIGADGIHSNTRQLAFGPEEPFCHYLGSTFNIFSMPNDLGLSHKAIVYAKAGRAADALAVRDSPELFCFPGLRHREAAVRRISRQSGADSADERCFRQRRLGSPALAGRAAARG
jgi:2-polyprenyl-6-methoxyphenol hydroxylase-like FAD-dependent oxidoreductase